MNNEFVCFVDKDNIQVNGQTEVKKHAQASEDLVFYLMLSHKDDKVHLRNPNRLTGKQVMDIYKKNMDESTYELEDTTYLMIILPCGDDERSFISAGMVRDIFLETEGWTCSEWTDIGYGDYAAVLTHNNPDVEVVYSHSFRFRMYNILSMAPVGITNFSVKLMNVCDGENLIHTFYIYKRPADMSIVDFSPNPHSVAQGEKVAFTWDANVYEEGYVFPGTFQIGTGGDEFRHVVEKSTEYQLRIQDKQRSVSRKSPVYLLPPRVHQFIYDKAERKVKWRCSYARSVTCMGANAPLTGACTLSDKDEEARLSCGGYLIDIEETLYLPAGFRDSGYLRKTIIQFPCYQVVLLRWLFDATVDVKLDMGLMCDVISSNRCGEFEYAAKKMPRIRLELSKKGASVWKKILL